MTDAAELEARVDELEARARRRDRVFAEAVEAVAVLTRDLEVIGRRITSLEVELVRVRRELWP
jgi:uncharacterized protein YPO0396